MIYLLTSILIILAILSLGENFAYPLIFCLIGVSGLSLSRWQNDNHPIVHLKIAINIAIVMVLGVSLYSFFNEKEHEILKVLINGWVYILVLYSFILYRKRDFYITQVVSLGLILFACSYPSVMPEVMLLIVIGFLGIWTAVLRRMNLAVTKEARLVTSKDTLNMPKEYSFIAGLFIGIALTALPIYLFMPRFKISTPIFLPPSDQKFARHYADYPREKMMSFFTKSRIKFAQKQQDYRADSSLRPQNPQEMALENQKTGSFDFWHSQEPTKYDPRQPPSEQEQKKLAGGKEKSIPGNKGQEDASGGGKEAGRPGGSGTGDQEDKRGPGSQAPEKGLSLFELIMYGLLILAIICLVLGIIGVFLPYLKEKRKIKLAALRNDYQAYIILVYKFLCRILAIFGFRYPVVIDPAEQAQLVSRRLNISISDFCNLTYIFVEARYSLHKCSLIQKQKALDCYRNVIEDLRKNSSGAGRLILRLGFLFDL